MFNIVSYITTSVFFFVLISNAVFYLALFEEKSWNIKRIFIHLRETKKGRSLLIGGTVFIKWLAIALYFLTIFQSGLDGSYHIFVFIIYLVLFIRVIKSLLDKEFSVPNFSITTILIFALTVSVEITLFIFAPIDRFFWMLILDKILPIIILLFFILLSVFFDFSQDAVLNRAIDKISKYKKLLTIAVVGSYGRGSTKEFISRILGLKYNVLTTHGSFNNSLDIATTINSQLSQNKQIFIAEIDDYKKDDVTQICSLINPKIVVISGINEQKLSIFGDMKKIIESKLEAINSLGRDGIALFNANTDSAKELYMKAKSKKFMLLVSEKNANADILATNINVGKFSVSFDVLMFGKRYKLLNIRLLGHQSIENLLPAIFIGVYAGIDFASIRRELEKIRPLDGTMVPRKTAKGAVLIDDTYSANINSVRRALSYMRLYKGKRILVLEPLVELGKNSDKFHNDLGYEIGKSCGRVFLTNDNYFKSISKGIARSRGNCIGQVKRPGEIIRFIKNECKNDDVVVFEGKETSKVISGISSERIY